jgi:hydrogenase maturation protein HypF
MSVSRCTIDVDGLAQGVGFRPLVSQLARRFGLGGIMYNRVDCVRIEIEGERIAIAGFIIALRNAPEPIAAVPRIVCFMDASGGDPVFRVVPSDISASSTAASERAPVAADIATCDECLRELFDPGDRRFGHPFINCADCGPRATIIVELPYDRARTTMAGFPTCPLCRSEYDSPTDRRFHAQPIACPACGPQLKLVAADGVRVLSCDPLAAFAAAIEAGGIGALKGIGGFHLICDATQEAAVAELRRRKHRDTKPFAIMPSDLASAERCCVLDDAAREALASPARPIVLCPARAAAGVAAAIAPGLHTLGLLLPYTATHHLLLRALGGRPVVVTSGNVSGEPIAVTDAEAFERLRAVADLFLTHDRPIHLRCEDSVMRATGGAVTPLRRSRGHAPLPIPLVFETSVPTLAVGGHRKAVFGFGTQWRALLSPHFGDLDSYAAHEAWRGSIAHFEQLFQLRPTRLIHDLHPEYASTRYAEQRLAQDPSLDLTAVQHHHAHVASCMADNALSGEVIGVCFDGPGLGPDGTSWGGEFLVGGYASVERAAHLKQVALPGGDRSARSPWRVALAYLRLAGLSTSCFGSRRQVEPDRFAAFERVLDSTVTAQKTSSMGRLFDAVAALAGVLCHADHEGEAAMRLEALAENTAEVDGYPLPLMAASAPAIVDTGPLVRAVVEDLRRGVSPARIARRFHTAVVELVVRTCQRIRAERALGRVVLTGGVFANAILSREIPARLAAEGFLVFQHRSVPPNDGGLCLGQLAIAAHGGGVSRVERADYAAEES